MGPPRRKREKTAGPSPAGRRPAAGEARPAPYRGLVNAILEVIRAIPRGRVAAYGQVAALAGSPRSARQVARVLHSLSETQGLPWHRVVNRNGGISLPMEGAGALQARLLRREGVAVDERGNLDLERFGWEAARGLRPRPRRRAPARRAGDPARRRP